MSVSVSASSPSSVSDNLVIVRPIPIRPSLNSPVLIKKEQEPELNLESIKPESILKSDFVKSDFNKSVSFKLDQSLKGVSDKKYHVKKSDDKSVKFPDIANGHGSNHRLASDLPPESNHFLKLSKNPVPEELCINIRNIIEVLNEIRRIKSKEDMFLIVDKNVISSNVVKAFFVIILAMPSIYPILIKDKQVDEIIFPRDRSIPISLPKRSIHDANKVAAENFLNENFLFQYIIPWIANILILRLSQANYEPKFNDSDISTAMSNIIFFITNRNPNDDCTNSIKSRLVSLRYLTANRSMKKSGVQLSVMAEELVLNSPMHSNIISYEYFISNINGLKFRPVVNILTYLFPIVQEQFHNFYMIQHSVKVFNDTNSMYKVDWRDEIRKMILNSFNNNSLFA